MCNVTGSLLWKNLTKVASNLRIFIFKARIAPVPSTATCWVPGAGLQTQQQNGRSNVDVEHPARWLIIRAANKPSAKFSLSRWRPLLPSLHIRHYMGVNPWYVDTKVGHQCKCHKGRLFLIIIASLSHFLVYLPHGLLPLYHSVLNWRALLGVLNQKKAPVIVKTLPMVRLQLY